MFGTLYTKEHTRKNKAGPLRRVLMVREYIQQSVVRAPGPPMMFGCLPTGSNNRGSETKYVCTVYVPLV
jgi:hypothetical protein